MLIGRGKGGTYFSVMEGSDTINCNFIKLLKLCLINPDELLELICFYTGVVSY